MDQISVGTHNHRRYIPKKYIRLYLCTLYRSWNFKERLLVLKNIFSIGCDGISTSLFKELAEVLSQPLLFIFNSCMKNGLFPVCLKVAKILPLFKKGIKIIQIIIGLLLFYYLLLKFLKK